MGSSSSSLASVTPVLEATENTTAEDVAKRVMELGPQYEAYSATIKSEGIDGAFLAGTTVEDLPGLFEAIGVSNKIHQKKLQLEFGKLKAAAAAAAAAAGAGTAAGAGASRGVAEVREADGTGAPTNVPFIAMQFRSSKKYLAFLSHFKEEAGAEARIVQSEMRQLLGPGHATFLDSDDLFDLRALLEDVKNSQCLVLFQTSGVLTRPWCLLELYTAVRGGVPIVCLSVKGPNAYDYGDALAYLTHIDSELEAANPGAQKFMESNGVDMGELAFLLANTIPNCISVDFNPRGSKNSIEASLKDLIQAVDAATVHELPPVSKEEWLAQRPPARLMATGNARKAHGGESLGASNAASALKKGGPATVPSAVPELPASFLSRPEHVDALKAELGREDGKPKIVAYGMGGAGKTTIATALVREEDVLARFDRLVWVSIGQEPDIRALSESLHAQLTGEALDSEAAKTPELVRDRLRDAARAAGRVLLVLDDVWAAPHLKDLDCLEYGDTGSKLLVTTRIRGLVGNKAVEINVGDLSEEDALALLLKYADEEALLDEKSSGRAEEYERAVQITTLCHQLPLTISIVGGMVKHNSSGFAADLLGMLESDLGAAKDEKGASVEERIIESSFSMIMKRDDSALIQAVFHQWAVFPEDCEVPKAVVDAFAPSLIGKLEGSDKEGKAMPVAKATFQVSSAIGTLLNFVLLSGSLNGSGVHIHDIVRDHVIAKHSEEDLRAKQSAAVEVLLAARPPGGFQKLELSEPGSVGFYVALHLHHHMRGSLLFGADGSTELPDRWLMHNDDVVQVACAMAVGHEKLMAMSKAAEARKDLILAAKLAWCGQKLGLFGRISIEQRFDEVFRAADLLFKYVRRAKGGKKAAVLGFALDALRAASYCDFGSERQDIAANNLNLLTNPPPTCMESFSATLGNSLMGLSCFQKLLVCCAMASTSSKDTYEAHLGKGMAMCFQIFQRFGFLGGPFHEKPDTFTDETYREAMQMYAKMFVHMSRARELAPLDDNVRRNAPVVFKFQILCCFPDFFRFDTSMLEPHLVEAEIVDAVSAWDSLADADPERKLLGINMSLTMSGGFLGPMIYRYGSINSVDIWGRKVLTAYDRTGLRIKRNYGLYTQEISFVWGNFILNYAVPLGKYAISWELAKGLGFESWHDKSNWELFNNQYLRENGGTIPLEETEQDRGFILFLCAPEGVIDPKEVNEWIDQWTLEEIVQYSGKHFYNKKMFHYSKELVLARVYMKLGRDDDAYKVCQLMSLPDHRTTKRFALSQCYNLMGQISGRRGAFDEAEKHFIAALGEAEKSGLPMFELLAARDWKKHALAPAGRPTDAAEAAIDSACAKMNKTRSRFASLLV